MLKFKIQTSSVPAPKMPNNSTEEAHDPRELCKYYYDRQAKGREWGPGPNPRTNKQTNKQTIPLNHRNLDNLGLKCTLLQFMLHNM